MKIGKSVIYLKYTRSGSKTPLSVLEIPVNV